MNCPLLGLMRDELAIFAGQTPDALKTPATPSWLISQFATAFDLRPNLVAERGVDRGTPIAVQFMSNDAASS